MILSYSILIALVSYTNGQSLTSSESVVEEPGRSVTLSCSVSGFSMGSYYMHWVRQKPGKGLEWIGRIDGGTGTRFAQSLQGQFSITKDISKNMLYLQVKSLKAEDTAVYYCARGVTGVAGGFDYWGKGTMVTVSSGGQTPPTSIFGVSSCSPSTDGFFTLGCVTSGFSPADSLSFSWTGDVTGKVDYPAMRSSDTYTAVSQVQVKASDWVAKKSFKCTATNPAGSREAQLLPPTPSEPKPATLLLTTHVELEKGNATFICVASQFSPKEHEFTWLLDNGKLTDGIRPEIVTEEKSTNTFTAISILEIPANDWVDRYSTVKCVFNNSDFSESKAAKYEALQPADVKVDITPPSSEDMLVLGAGDLECKAAGPTGFSGIRWLRNGEELVSTIDASVEGDYMSATTTISYEEWSKGIEYICEVKHSNFVEHFKNYPYRREEGPNRIRPSVYLIPPPENSVNTSVTLTCYVKRFYPKDIVVHWLANDTKLNNTDQFQQRTTSLIKVKENLYSVYSQLVVELREWNSGTTFTCLAYHESIDPTVRMIARSTENGNNKPTLVSLNMNVPSLPTCAV